MKIMLLPAAREVHLVEDAVASAEVNALLIPVMTVWTSRLPVEGVV
jgi:hypothetical protein